MVRCPLRDVEGGEFAEQCARRCPAEELDEGSLTLGDGADMVKSRY
jgi:hypothetical protein